MQYAKRMVGNKLGGNSTYIPLKVNMAGVIPVIFASSLLYIPQLVVSLTGSQAGWAQWVQRNFDRQRALYLVVYFLLIIFFFAYFYVAITFNPVDVADDMKKYGGFIPGIRPGRPLDRRVPQLRADPADLSGIAVPGRDRHHPVRGIRVPWGGAELPVRRHQLLIMVGVGWIP